MPNLKTMECTPRHSLSCPLCGQCRCARSAVEMDALAVMKGRLTLAEAFAGKCPLHSPTSQHGTLLYYSPETISTVWGEFPVGGEG